MSVKTKNTGNAGKNKVLSTWKGQRRDGVTERDGAPVVAKAAASEGVM